MLYNCIQLNVNLKLFLIKLYMSKLSPRDFDGYLSNIIGNDYFNYKFIPCIEYSKQVIPIRRSSGGMIMPKWKNDHYEFDEYYDVESYNPLDRLAEELTRFSNDVDFLGFNGVPNDIFLEFDFKHRFHSTQRKWLFGKRTELEAKEYYYKTVKHNSYYLGEMNLARSGKIGDIDRAIKAYNKYTGDRRNVSLLSYYIYDFIPWIGPINNQFLQEQLVSDAPEYLTIFDFYNIIPDNPSVDDLIKVYSQHKEYIDTIKLIGHDYCKMIHNKYFKYPNVYATSLNCNVILVAVFTKDEFEETIFESIKAQLDAYKYSNLDDFKSQCTIERMTKRWHKYSLCERVDCLAEDNYEKIIITFRPSNKWDTITFLTK